MGSYLQFRDFSEYKVSAWALIAANLLPLFGVLYLGWDTFSIVVLYWVENVIIGAINVLKMIACNPDPDAVDWSGFKPTDDLYRIVLDSRHDGTFDKVRLANHGMKLFFVPFFIAHYGLFCLVHGVFVFVLFGHGTLGLDPFDELFNIDKVFTTEHLWWAVLPLAGSHLYSFFVNYLGRGEYRRTVVPLLMFQPYARVVVLHMAILLGGFVSFALGSNALVLMILVIGKTMLDLSLHLRERMRNAMSQPRPPRPIMPEVILDEAGQTPATPAVSAPQHPPARSSSGD